MPDKYIPGSYWDGVAKQINRREGANFVAGDDEPYYRYKREKFLELLNRVDFAGKKVLEVGAGPGGNLLEIVKHGPTELYGVDISREMITLARKNTGNSNIILLKTSETELPFQDNYFDIVVTATVLQHITDDVILKTLVKNMCRVAAADIYIFERIERRRKETMSNTGRTVKEYAACFTSNGFALQNTRFAYIHVSYITCGMARKLFNRKDRKEAEAVTSLCTGAQKILLPVTRQLDKIFRKERDLAMLHFKRTEPGI